MEIMRLMLLVFTFLLFLSNNLFATVDVIAVNKFTKELTVYELESTVYYGLFWEKLSGEDHKLMKEHEYYLSHGYKYTQFSYKIELVLLIVLTLFIVFYKILIKRRLKN